jgi:hypothetical protein
VAIKKIPDGAAEYYFLRDLLLSGKAASSIKTTGIPISVVKTIKPNSLGGVLPIITRNDMAALAAIKKPSRMKKNIMNIFSLNDMLSFLYFHAVIFNPSKKRSIICISIATYIFSIKT